MEEGADISLLDMIDSLRKDEFGDQTRLAEIRDRLINGRTIYNSDKAYVKSKFTELAMTSSNLNADRAIPDHKPEQSVEQDATCHHHDCPDEITLTRKSVKPEPSNQSSRAWYLLPIFLWLLGGLISYACLRKDHPSRARKTLILGVGLSVPAILVILVALIVVVSEDVTSSDIDSVDLSDGEIKRNALSVPYESLLNNNEQYVGEIIHYDGQVLQVRKSTFGNSYVLRIATNADGLFASKAIWANHKASTDEESRWLDELNRSQNPLAQAGPDNMIQVFGIVKGLKDYQNLFGGTVTVPEIDILILERGHSEVGTVGGQNNLESDPA